MALGDPSEIGFKSGAAGLTSLGEGIQTAAGAFAQRKQQDDQEKLKVMGGLLGHMLDKGLVKPDNNFTNVMAQYFGGLGFKVSDPQTLADVMGSVNTKNFTKKIKVGAQGQVEGAEFEEKSPEEEARKEEELKLKIAEGQRKEQEIKASSVKEATAGIPFYENWFGSPRAKEAEQLRSGMRQQLLGKTKPQYDTKTQKLQMNPKTSEYRVVDK